MKPAWALLGLLCAVTVSAMAADAPVETPYHAYWLSSEPRGEYEDLILSRRPITALAGSSLASDEAVVITTYARDSIWNTDRRPVKPLPVVEQVTADRITLGGRTLRWVPARLEEAARLLRAPGGTIPIHRMHGAADGQEDVIRSWAERILSRN